MMTDEDFIDGELLGVVPELTVDNLSKVQWRMRNKQLIYLKDMEDSHVRNAAMFLLGFGYAVCGCDEEVKLLWLKVLKMEWERRMLKRANGLKVWTVTEEQMKSMERKRRWISE